MLEAALKERYGMLKGGGFSAHRASTLPSDKGNVEQLIHQMWFSSELAAHLLTGKVEVDTPAWNAKLNRLIAVSEGAWEDRKAGAVCGLFRQAPRLCEQALRDLQIRCELHPLLG